MAPGHYLSKLISFSTVRRSIVVHVVRVFIICKDLTLGTESYKILIRLRARMTLVLEGMRNLLRLEMQVPELHVELLVRALPSNFNLRKRVLTKLCPLGLA